MLAGMRRALALLGLATAGLLLGSCHNEPDTKTYDQISASAGIGIPFNTSPEQAEAKFGKPTQTLDRGPLHEDYYIVIPAGQEAPTMPDPTVTQFTLSFYDNKLVRVYNCYHPEIPGSSTPPVVAEPIAGVKLGLKRTQIENLLGKPNYGTMKDGWEFVGKDGRAISILPHYTEVKDLNASLASDLTIEYHESGSVNSGKGEYYEKRKQRQQTIHNLTAK